MLWDFHGPRAERTAEHQRKHRDEFVVEDAVEQVESGVEQLSEQHWAAFMIVAESQVEALRASLRPQRGLEA